MKIIQCHNFYARVGGEDLSVRSEAELLKRHGHEVIPFYAYNSDAKDRLFGGAKEILFNRKARAQLTELIDETNPDIVHVTNSFPLLSLSIYCAASNRGVPIVQSLRNFRYSCLNGYLYRNGAPCDRCLHRKVMWPGVVFRCYNNSLPQSAAAATTLSLNRVLGVWKDRVHAFIAISKIVRDKLILAGLPADRMHLKPNFLVAGEPNLSGMGDGFFFAGMLSEQKGVKSLVKAWLGDPTLPSLTIAGEGPLEDFVREHSHRNERLRFAGRLQANEVLEKMSMAKAVIVPSQWDEPFGRVTLEAFSLGIPVIGSNLGATPDMIQHGMNGWLFEGNDLVDLRQQLRSATDVKTEDYRVMRHRSYQTYRSIGTPEANYETLLSIYHSAIQCAGTPPINNR